MTTLYRYCDERGDPFPRVLLCKYEVIRETECFYYISWAGGMREKRVGKGARKSFAYPTLERARNSFTIRKKRQLVYLSRYHDAIKLIVDRIDAGDWDFNWPFDEFGFPILKAN